MNPFANVDLEACACVDTRHHMVQSGPWFFIEAGPLRRIPVRTMVCLVCSTKRIEHCRSDGTRVGNPDYEHDPAYIDNARKLGEYWERAKNYRAEHQRRQRAAERAEKRGSGGGGSVTPIRGTKRATA